MKVVLVSNMYTYPGNWDKLDALARYVDLHAITPERWATEKELHPVSSVRQDGSRGWVHHPLPTLLQGNPFRYVYRPGPLIRVLRDVRPDLVHVEQEPESLSLLQLSLLKVVFRYPVLFVAWENVNPLRLGAGFRVLNYLLADGAMFGNEEALARARRLGYRGPASVTPQYAFEPEPVPARRPGACFTVGFAGRLVPEKGIANLLNAMARLPGAELVVAGDGPLRDLVRGAPRVRWLGNLDRDDMDAFWGAIDVLAVPSLTIRPWAEQFGRVIVEAMARGVPVVASSSGAIPEVVGGAGLVFAEGDDGALAAAVERIRTEPDLRASLADAGRARVHEVYRPEVVMPRTVQAYRAVLRRTGSSAR